MAHARSAVISATMPNSKVFWDVNPKIKPLPCLETSKISTKIQLHIPEEFSH